MNQERMLTHIRTVLEKHDTWRGNWAEFEADPALEVDDSSVTQALGVLFDRLDDNYPFFHPMYAGQMLKPPHDVAVLGYLAAMLINPNNHALDGGPATGQMEKEIVAELAEMFGYSEHLGHLTSSGTIANLEALWIARRLNPSGAVAFSSQSHYTHQRMCEVLGVRSLEVLADSAGRMDVQALRQLCLSENIGTVVVTLGTTALGALDPLPAILELREEFGFRIHIDSAYGGFFKLVAGADGIDAAVFDLMHEADSIVVDPHKHGLQPYGCGCVLFRDPSIGSHYKHDSPYTYFTSDDLHLGEISLECSRAGASAAALWFTTRLLPLKNDVGLGPVLRRCRTAALEWTELLRTSEHLFLLLEPELDIVAFFPATSDRSSSAISKTSDHVFEILMEDKNDPVYLSKLRVPSTLLHARYPDISVDHEWTTVLRSTLMKPEHASRVRDIHKRVEQAVMNLT